MTLLLCEDERDLSAAIRKILEISKYEVDVAYDGVMALEAISSRRYDGIILDVMMPRLDGFQVLKRIRAEGNNVPVIMLTAKAEIDDKVLGLDSGADDYLTKPFAAKELLARIKATFEGRADRVFELDGVSVEFKDWWCNVRMSNTEPLVRLNLEADTPARMEEKRDELLALIRA